MPRVRHLGKGATRKIHSLIDDLYNRAKARLLGPGALPKRIDIRVSYIRDLSLPGVFEAGAREEGAVPSIETLEALLRIAAGFVDASRERAKARVINAINSFINESAARGGATPDEIQTVLGGQLQDVWGEVTNNIHSIVDTEAQKVRNTSILDGIVLANAEAGIADPTVYFVVVRDKDLCDECKRLHLMEDGKTPRLWKLSQLGHGYHKKADDNPKLGGLHPHCRCVLCTLLPGYGFDKLGKVTYKKLGFDAYADQQE